MWEIFARCGVLNLIYFLIKLLFLFRFGTLPNFILFSDKYITLIKDINKYIMEGLLKYIYIYIYIYILWSFKINRLKKENRKKKSQCVIVEWRIWWVRIEDDYDIFSRGMLSNNFFVN